MRGPGPWRVFAAASVAYGLAAAPGLTWLDAGELGASAWELGVAHPPGFPVFALLHKLVMLLIPVGDVAFRGNLASGLCMAAALALLYAAGRRLGARPLACGLAVACLGLTRLAGLHAGTIEVYTGAALLLSGLLWIATRAEGAPEDQRWPVAGALLVGLSLGHHPELWLLGGLCALAWAPRLGRQARSWTLSAGAALVGALVVFYLPLRAATDPWRNWGDPDTWSRLWAHLSGARIRAAYSEEMGAGLMNAAGDLGLELMRGGGPLLVLALIGLVIGLRRPAVRLAGLCFVVDAAYSVLINPMGLRDAQNGLLGLTALALPAALGLEEALLRLDIRRQSRPPALAWLEWGNTGVLALACLVGSAVTAGGLRAQRADQGLPRILQALGAEAPPETATFVASDNLAAGLAFAQVVEGMRPDMAVVVRQHIWDPSSIDPVRRRLPEALAGWRPGGRLADLAALQPDSTIPVRWEWARGLDGSARPRDLTPMGLIFGRSSSATSTTVTWANASAQVDRLTQIAADARAAQDTRAPLTPQARRALANLWLDRGLAAASARAARSAGEAAARAVEINPDEHTTWNTAGVIYSSLGQMEPALYAADRAWQMAPDHQPSALNRLRYLVALSQVNRGQMDQAKIAADALVARWPESADGWALRGVINGRAGLLEAARRDFEQALSLDQTQPEALQGMRVIRQQRMKGSLRATP